MQRTRCLFLAIVALLLGTNCGHEKPGTAVIFYDSNGGGSDLSGSPVYRLHIESACLYVRSLAFRTWSTEEGALDAVMWPQQLAKWNDVTKTLTFEGVDFQDGDIIDFVGPSWHELSDDELSKATGDKPCNYKKARVAVWTNMAPREAQSTLPSQDLPTGLPDGAGAVEVLLSNRTGLSVEVVTRRLRLQEASHGVRDDLRELAPKRVVSLTLEHEPEMHIVATFTGPLDTLPDASKIVAESPLPIEFRSAGD